MTRRGLFVGRFQPFHDGHLSTILEMEKAPDVDEIIVGIGSAQLKNTSYNPFSADEREEMIRQSLNITKPYHIVRINDINDYPNWVPYVQSLCPPFEVVYSGNTITKMLFADTGYEIRDSEITKMISATEVRELMNEGGDWQDYVPAGTADVIKKIDGVERIKRLVGRYMNPAVTGDLIVWCDRVEGSGIVLVKRKKDPFRGKWAIPGGHLIAGQETTEMAAIREGKEETGLEAKNVRLLGVYSKPGRDPRGPYVAVAYYTNEYEGVLRAGDDADAVRVFSPLEIPVNRDGLAFDHRDMLDDYFAKMGEMQYTSKHMKSVLKIGEQT